MMSENQAPIGRGSSAHLLVGHLFLYYWHRRRFQTKVPVRGRDGRDVSWRLSFVLYFFGAKDRLFLKVMNLTSAPILISKISGAGWVHNP